MVLRHESAAALRRRILSYISFCTIDIKQIRFWAHQDADEIDGCGVKDEAETRIEKLGNIGSSRIREHLCEQRLVSGMHGLSDSLWTCVDKVCWSFCHRDRGKPGAPARRSPPRNRHRLQHFRRRTRHGHVRPGLLGVHELFDKVDIHTKPSSEIVLHLASRQLRVKRLLRRVSFFDELGIDGGKVGLDCEHRVTRSRSLAIRVGHIDRRIDTHDRIREAGGVASAFPLRTTEREVSVSTG